jgi:hypothetical protein
MMVSWEAGCWADATSVTAPAASASAQLASSAFPAVIFIDFLPIFRDQLSLALPPTASPARRLWRERQVAPSLVDVG